ncbi:MAG: hypothetical protein M1524_01090 [Patescibacteria group bacterium]|nr:hypothetical protein [Patescibacteria group bacterium]
MTALAYQWGGIVGSRFLNVLFGVLLVEEVYRFTRLLKLYNEKINKLAALCAAFFVAFSGIGIFVSKLATYDMPSFFLFMIGINSFLKAEYYSNGKYYFLAFLCLFAAFLTKIVIAIFFPILLILSIFIIKDRSLDHKKRSIVYLYVTLAIAKIVLFVNYRDNLMTYITFHKDLGKTENYLDILALIWQESQMLLILFIPSAFLFILSKKRKTLISLALLAFTIPVFHLALLRYATLDKHLYLSVIFLSVIAGYGVSKAIFYKDRTVRLLTEVLLPIVVIMYIVTSYRIVIKHQSEWSNTMLLQSYLNQKVHPGDKVLTEEGGVVILALYDKIFPPTNIVTFDWINYSGLQDDPGYLRAVNDQYFDYIEIGKEQDEDSPRRNKIRNAMAENYSVVYKKDNFEVYERRKD